MGSMQSSGQMMRPPIDYELLAEIALDYYAWTRHVRDWWDVEEACLGWTIHMMRAIDE